MKRLSRIFTSFMVVVLLACACFSFTGCSKEEIIKVELKIAVYNYEKEEWYSGKDTTLTIDLYRHLAPDTVDTMVKYIKNGYYNDAIFYCTKSDLNKIFVGDLKMDDLGNIYQNEIMPTIDGEFEYGTTKGSNLKVTEGSIALWRTWYKQDNFNVSSNLHTGRATWFMPTQSLSDHNGWFCVFALIDMANTANANTWAHIKNAVMPEANSDVYNIYYTGEYDRKLPNQNNGLTFHCEKGEGEVLPEHQDNVFIPENNQYRAYEQTAIRVARGVDGAVCGARIVSAKVVG